ncbi:hypothetical protein B0T26DRAFT_677155 [Lasiosphaeria miniovina]|uniref:Uncharacterized protein n=1 Tax=Lasiosphaeria miniovina TaxID=1954250 RepID=A0AA40DTD5_9PEZI|nr:uncharacterized protein B0T26DRAFT_677155 [Lasiosphaeria miniovina]KAK0712731.1 hypothetical protein B0T26DRAFT_677155 [Lasiosphaeria miniovina]
MASNDSGNKKTDSKEAKSLRQIIDTTPFHVLFDGRSPGSRQSYTTTLGYYISLTKENAAAMRASDGQVPAMVKISFVSKHRPPESGSVLAPPSPPSAGGDGSDDTTGGGASGGDGTVADGTRPTIQHVDTTGMVAAGSETVSTHVATMTESQWHIVMVTNSLLQGFHILGATGLLTTAREAAFKLKRSYPDPYGKPIGGSEGTAADGKTEPPLLFCIPQFQVTDDSSVTISEIKRQTCADQDTLSPTSWIASVGSFYNWRVMRRDGLTDILRLIKDVTAVDWPAVFDGILNPKAESGSGGGYAGGGHRHGP